MIISGVMTIEALNISDKTLKYQLWKFSRIRSWVFKFFILNYKRSKLSDTLAKTLSLSKEEFEQQLTNLSFAVVFARNNTMHYLIYSQNQDHN